MKRLHSFILKSYIGPFILTFLIAMFVLLMQFLWRYIEELVGKGLDTSVIAELIIYTSASLVPMALPLAILISSIMTFGDFGENYELTAMKAAGISLMRIMRPLIALTLIIGIGTFFFSNYVLPIAQLKTGELLYDIRHRRPELNIKVGSFNSIENYAIKIGKKNNQTQMMYNVMFFDHSQQNGNKNVTVSDSAQLYLTKDQKYLVMSLYHGYTYVEGESETSSKKTSYFPMQRNHFETQRLIRELNEKKTKSSNQEIFRANHLMKNLKDLNFTIDSLKKDYVLQSRMHQDFVIANSIFKNEERFKKPNDTVSTIVLSDRKLTKDSVIVDYDQLISGMPSNEKAALLNASLAYANKTQTLLKASSSFLDDKMLNISRNYIEWHRKFTLSVSCIIFFFIGAPLGAIIRKGGLGWPIVISIIFFIFYYIISLIGEKMSREGLPAHYGMWIASVILIPLGAFLTYKATVDSSVMQISTYSKFFKKLIPKKSK